MSQNDYVIANQTTPLFRADLNTALQALASNSSGATAPATTYANMLWYDTASNILKMRSEADDAWIDLGTLDQSANTFAPAGVAELTQVQAEDDTSTVFGQVSGERLGQAVAANGLGGSEQTWQDMTASRAASTSYQNTTGGPISVSITQGVPRYFQISTDNVTWFNLGKFADATSKPSAHFFIIPDLIYYRINGSVTLLEWWELR